MPRKHNLTTFDVAALLHVDPGSVANWVDGGLLKAHRTPGGHRRVNVDDLLNFLKAQGMPIPEQLEVAPVRVLIVDDEPPVAQMLSRAVKLRHPEYEVLEAYDGFRAGTMVATLKPDVVLLDLRMPGMDGFQVCEQIKSNEATKRATVIAITAYASDESTRRILACGAKLCMPKPLDMDQLMAEIEKAAGQT